ncbi:hypothetical protein ACL2XG_17275 [Sodalis sp. RH24]|uniref:hypothetical protein n=1 Tax=unclassified Sodalis (in: enterobacteria) TaxID=2636512 RepID=UPI0039B438E7
MYNIHSPGGPPAIHSLPAGKVRRPGGLSRLTSHLKVAENCCDRCRPVWRQWHAILESTLRKAGEKEKHPYRAVSIGLQCVRALADKLMTPQDHAALAGMSIHVNRRHGLNWSARLHALKLVDGRAGQPPDQASEEERAATHLIARVFMNGVLNQFMKSEIRSTIIARNRSYHTGLDALPPYRDVDGNAVTIIHLNRFSLATTANNRYANDQVVPFASGDVSGADRAALYAGLLQCRKLTRNDVPEREKSLIGQWGVMAARPLAKGTCVGIYAGVLVPEGVCDKTVFDHDYLISIAADDQEEEIILDGDGIISKINTLVEYDEHGRPCRQARSGYNVEMARFPAILANKRTVSVIAVFTLADIPAGVELRCNYKYRDHEIRRLR